jgi:hypothetical protein
MEGAAQGIEAVLRVGEAVAAAGGGDVEAAAAATCLACGASGPVPEGADSGDWR